MRTAYPYPRLTSDIDICVDSVSVNGNRLSLGLISASNHVVALHSVKATWESLRIQVTVTLDHNELSAGPWEWPSCVAVVTNAATKIREVQPLEPVGPGAWKGTLELNRGDHSGTCMLEAALVASVEGISGRTVGSSLQRWRVDFDAVEPSQEQVIKTVWRDFTDDSERRYTFLNKFREDPWALDATSEPVLYLNSAVEGFRALFSSERVGEQKMVRELIAAQISSEVWIALFNTAVYRVEMGEEGMPEWPGGWHEQVLRKLLPDVFDGMSPDEALAEVLRGRIDGGDGSLLQQRLVHAAGIQARKSRSLPSVLKQLGRMAGQEGAR